MADITLRIKQGEDWSKTIPAVYQNGALADLSVYSSFEMEIKSRPQDINPVAKVTVTSNVSTSSITFGLTHVQNRAIPAWGKTADDVTKYVSDLYGNKTDGTRKKLCSIDMEIEPEVTKP